MGIRFLCHQCEKRLNVTAKQAGQEGQCPNCMAVVAVPMKSTIPSLKEKQKSARRPGDAANDSFVGLHDADDQITMDGTPAETLSSNLVAKIKSEATPITKSQFDSDNSTELFMLDKPTPPESRGKVDPIAEAPNSVWYFRSHELGEKGPLKGKVMQKHLDRGDVAVGCVVWREDWEDWAPAELVFPTLVAQAKEDRRKARLKRAFKEANYEIPDEVNPHSELRRRQRRNNLIFAFVIALGLGIVALLVYVLTIVLAG
ncbi:MAG: hypothetical protein AB8B55_02475 [Mariniblastus sp.]